MTADESDQGGHVWRTPDVAGPDALVEVADGVWILPDRDRIPLVPNIGFIAGTRSLLVIESGIGIGNGERVLEMALELAAGRRLFITSTHFHPEHGYGVQAFTGAAAIVYSRTLRDELAEKQRHWADYFSSFSPVVAKALEGVEYVPADLVFDDAADLELGSRTVQLRHSGPAHTRGDQVVFLPQEGILFAGDLVEERFFAIMPDEDTRANQWVSRLEQLEQLPTTVVVPGHGALGDGGLVAVARECLVLARDRVAELHGSGSTLEEIVAVAEPEILGRYPDWDNRDWVGTMLRTFHAELVAGVT